MLTNYASSFIQFMEEFLLTDTSDDIKVLFTAIKGIKLVIRQDSTNIGRRINLKKLISNLLYKLNDTKLIARIEVERVIIDISSHMQTQDVILLLLQSLETRRLSDIGVKGVLQVIMILYLKHQKEIGNPNNLWGKSSRVAKRTTSILDDDEQEFFANAPGAFDNLYLRLVEPVCYLYS